MRKETVIPAKPRRPRDTVHRLRRQLKAQAQEIVALRTLIDCERMDRAKALSMARYIVESLETVMVVPE